MRPLEADASAVHHQLRVAAGEDDEAVAPARVAQHAAAQQHALVADGVRLAVRAQHAVKLTQTVVGRLTDQLTCGGEGRGD